MYYRKKYLEQLNDFKNTEFIKVITGVRRAGKSMLLNTFKMQLTEEKANIIYINFEEFKFNKIKDYERLNDYIAKNLKNDIQNYLLIDEIQLVDQYELVINSLRLKSNVDIYITGSNSHMLSGELVTLLSGRYVEIKVYPFSYREYIDYLNLSNSNEQLNRYLVDGGMPTIIMNKPSKEMENTILDSLVNSIIISDIMSYNNTIELKLLQSILFYMLDNIGNETSINKIKNYITSNNYKTTNKKVSEIISAFEKAFLFYKCQRYNINGKELLKTNAKYYLVDQTFRKILYSNIKDIGRVIENVVYIELLRLGYNVTIGKIDTLEIDFIVQKQETIKYIQVAYSIQDEKTLTRELKSLYKIKDNYPKIIITMDNYQEILKDGIIHIPLNTFLTDGL